MGPGESKKWGTPGLPHRRGGRKPNLGRDWSRLWDSLNLFLFPGNGGRLSSVLREKDVVRRKRTGPIGRVGPLFPTVRRPQYPLIYGVKS